MKRLTMSVSIVALLWSPSIQGQGSRPSPDDYRRIAGEVETSLKRDVLDKWFPAAVDRQGGGFYENFAADWSRGADGERSIVYQSRLTWLSAQAALRFAKDREQAEKYRAITRHGAAFLADKLNDREHGGFYWAVDVGGHPVAPFGSEKHVYGIAFGIYALAASYQATHDAASLDLAKKTAQWLDAHAHDFQHGGGYFEALTAEGEPILSATTRATDAIGTRYGLKSMNTHIHLLEAFTGLHEVWPDPVLHRRLEELFQIVRDKIVVEPGCQCLYFNLDWRPVPDLDSFGHDIETAYLLTEAAAAVDKPEDAAAWTAARHLVDHALEFGFDPQHGGFYNEGTTFGRDVTKEKIWWVEAEGLNALLLMHERFGRETPQYWDAFVKQWDFISKHQIDAVHGGWYPMLAADGQPRPNQPKSDRWTEGYHQGRALMNVSDRLRRLADSDVKAKSIPAK
jgi:mannobiose 2-epimerase